VTKLARDGFASKRSITHMILRSLRAGFFQEKNAGFFQEKKFFFKKLVLRSLQAGFSCL